MRFLTALVLAFVVFIGLPAFAAADTPDDTSMEQVVDTLDVAACECVTASAPDLDAETAPSAEVAEPTLFAELVPLPGLAPTRSGPDGFSREIWRPVDRADSAPTRNYESGLALRRS